MTTRFDRRTLLAGLAASAAGPAFANAPLTSIFPQPKGEVPPRPPSSPATSMVKNAGLGGTVAYQVVNADTGEVIEEMGPDLRLPPASVAKAATAYWGLSKLGADYRFCDPTSGHRARERRADRR